MRTTRMGAAVALAAAGLAVYSAAEVVFQQDFAVNPSDPFTTGHNGDMTFAVTNEAYRICNEHLTGYRAGYALVAGVRFPVAERPVDNSQWDMQTYGQKWNRTDAANGAMAGGLSVSARGQGFYSGIMCGKRNSCRSTVGMFFICAGRCRADCMEWREPEMALNREERKTTSSRKGE